MQKVGRFWEVDFIRGVAIILMVVFNYAFALSFLNIYHLDGGWLFWFLFPRIIGGIFITLVGISLTLSYNKLKQQNKGVHKKYIIRGLKIFGLGMLITISTWFLFPQVFIVFGILHLIGISIILSIPLIKLKNLNLILGFLIVFVGFYLQNLRFDFPYFIWLGFIPKNFSTLDYFPLLPWFGLVLIGLFLGNTFYKDGKRNFKIINLTNYPVVKNIHIMGRHSLLIYLLHQPILVLVLKLFGFI